MPKRPFAEGSRRVVWDELVSLRDGPGLTPGRVESLAPTFLALSPIKETWEAKSHLRGEIGCLLLMIWALRMEEPNGPLVRAAYNVSPDVPNEYREHLVDRRAYAADEANIHASTAQGRENEGIRDLIIELIPDAAKPAAPTGTVYEVKQPGRAWTKIDPVASDGPEMDQMIRVTKERFEYTYDSAGRLVRQDDTREFDAIDEPIKITGIYVNYPGVVLNRLGIEMLEGATLGGLQTLTGYLGVVFHLDKILKAGDHHRIRYATHLDGYGHFEAFQRFAHEYPLDRLIMTVTWDPAKLPSRVWWFEDLPRDDTPGPALPDHLLYPTEADPVATKTFGPKRATPYYHGIGWEW